MATGAKTHMLNSPEQAARRPGHRRFVCAEGPVWKATRSLHPAPTGKMRTKLLFGLTLEHGQLHSHNTAFQRRIFSPRIATVSF